MLDLIERNRWAFSLLELCAVLIVVALLVAVLLPSIGSGQRPSRQLTNNTQVRGIHQSMVMFAQDNGGYFPGLSADGELLEAGTIEGAAEDGAYPGARYVILLSANYFYGDYAISLAESGKTEWTTTGTSITTDHFSFALLALDLDGNGRVDRPDPLAANGESAEPHAGRTHEWSETLNSLAPVLADRNTGANATDRASSLHTPLDSGDWRGSVGWNDNRVVFESSPTLDTRYGDGPFWGAGQGRGDHLFVADSIDAADDAAMVFQDSQTLVRQR